MQHKNYVQTHVLGTRFDHVTMDDMRAHITAFATQRADDNMFVVTANPEIVDYAFEDAQYQTVINQADVVVPDGIGVVKAAGWLGTPMPERVPGIELMDVCLEIAQANKQKVFLLGATEEVVQLAQQKLQQKFPDVTFGHHHGYIDVEDETIANEIQAFNPDYLFVGMGFPKQELWINRYKAQFKGTYFMGVGGAIAANSGTVKRAPQCFIRLNLEWLYRILTDLKRLPRMKRLPSFVIKVLKQRQVLKRLRR